MDKKNLKYKKYFKKLYTTLERFDNKFLFHIRDLYKRDIRKEKIPETKKNYSYLKNLFNKSYIFDDVEKIKKAKLGFISHYVGNQIKNKNLDFYYGNLFKDFQSNLPFFVVLINHTDESLANIKKKFENSKITRVYVNNNFNIMSEIKIFFKITSEYAIFLIKKNIYPKKFHAANAIKKRFDYKLFLNARYTFRLSNRITNILNICYNLKNVVVTYEGHAFEKIVFNYCKTRNIKSFGYFCSIIREYKNNIYYDFHKDYQPNFVLTSGKIAQQDLNKYSPHKKIDILGSYKNSFKKKNLNFFKRKKKITSILVCPEGLFSEISQMFRLINNEFLFENNIKFIFRTHPLIKIHRDLNIDNVNTNIIFSNESDIKKDFKKCDIILYKGSSVCIEAVMNGLIPLNFHEDKNCFSYDPLYKVNNFKVRNSKMIKLFVNSLDKKEKRVKIKKNTGKIQKYCELYFQKLNQSSLINNLVDEKN